MFDTQWYFNILKQFLDTTKVAAQGGSWFLNTKNVIQLAQAHSSISNMLQLNKLDVSNFSISNTST